MTSTLKNRILIIAFSCFTLLCVIVGAIFFAPTKASAYTETAYLKTNEYFDVDYNYTNEWYEITTTNQRYNDNGLFLNQNTENISSITFNLYMTGLGEANRYFPCISFLDKNASSYTLFQFCCWGSALSLKASGAGYNKEIKKIPFEGNCFDGKVTIEPNGTLFVFYINDELFTEVDLTTLSSTLTYQDNSSLSFGLQKQPITGTAEYYPVPEWMFYNVKLDYTTAPTLTDTPVEEVPEDNISEVTSPNEGSNNFAKLFAIIGVVTFSIVEVGFWSWFIYRKSKKKKTTV